jgi:hypothetical protein
LDDAEALLGIIREELHLEMGLKAIEVSAKTIEEAISVKRLTGLAFLFTPLSMATSIYGMNLDELNHTGPSVKVFLVTAGCLLGTTLIVWRVIGSIENWWIARKLQRRRQGFQRCYKVFWRCACNGHFWWLIRSGIFLGLLSDHLFGDVTASRRAERRLECKTM